MIELLEVHSLPKVKPAAVSYPTQGTSALKIDSKPTSVASPSKYDYENLKKKYTAPDHEELPESIGKVRISKSKIVEGLSCEKKVYLSVHNPALKQSHSLSQQARFAAGEEIGVLARNLFENGLLIEAEYWEAEKAIETTEHAISKGHNVLYEALFGGSAGLKWGHFSRITGPIWPTIAGLKVDTLLLSKG